MKPVDIKLYTYTEPITGCKCVKAVTNYVGQNMFAIAKCDPIDAFDQEFGEKLATTRLNIKIAKRRIALAKERSAYATEYKELLEKELRRVTNTNKREEASVEERLDDYANLVLAEEALLAAVK
jgi:hypothetical protein